MQCVRPLARLVVPRYTLSGFHLCSVSLSDSTSSKGSAPKKESPKKAEPVKTKPQQEPAASKKKTPATPSLEKEIKFDNTSYKVPEYYGHNEWSFYDIENTMKKFRIPQPSSVK